MAKASLGKLAYYLALIGGVILIIMGLLSFLRMPFSLIAFSMFGSFGWPIGAIIEIVLGLVAVYGSKRVTDLVWAIVLIVVGIIAGDLGGILVLLGGIVGLLSKYI